MEIHKLKDEVPEGRKSGSRDISEEAVDGPTLTITDLKQGVKNPNRVNVFVNDKFAFSLDVTQVVDLKLKIGRVLAEEELTECKKASEFGKTYQRALEWVLVRPRSVWELKDYLKRRERKQEMEEKKREWQDERKGKPKKRKSREKYNFDEVIIERLILKGYVDDRKFAEYYVENRFVKKGISQKRLRMELMKKGVSKEIMETVLDERNDEEEARKMIAKRREKYDGEKLVTYLCRQGFKYDLAKKLVEEIGED